MGTLRKDLVIQLSVKAICKKVERRKELGDVANGCGERIENRRERG